jgi:putative Ca2+/H+ antiporter (TMEM165/GDT1 family)
VAAFWQSLGIIFLAEMGDKTQLVSLALASRYGAVVVLGGVFAATLAVHLLSVAIGELLGLALPLLWIQVLAGLAFVGFGLWTLRGDTLDDDTGHQHARFGAFVAVAVTFFLAELGDKTMLATVTIASQQQAFVPVWLGSTLGMVVADGLAIGVGVVAGKRLPARAIQLGAAAIFLAFGTLTLGSALVGAAR